jgi:hypothetical protein
VIKNGAAIGIPVLQIDDPVWQHDASLLDVPVAPVVEKNRFAMVTQPELEADVTFGLGRLVIWLDVQKGSGRVFCSNGRLSLLAEESRFFRLGAPNKRGMRLPKPTRK